MENKIPKEVLERAIKDVKETGMENQIELDGDRSKVLVSIEIEKETNMCKIMFNGTTNEIESAISTVIDKLAENTHQTAAQVLLDLTMCSIMEHMDQKSKK